MRLVYRAKQVILLLGDYASFCLGFLVALTLRTGGLPTGPILHLHGKLFLLTFLLWILVNYIAGLYDLAYLNHRRFFTRFGHAMTVSLAVSIAFFYLLPDATITPKTILLLSIVLGYGISTLWRLLFRRLVRAKTIATQIMFVGYTPEVAEIMQVLSAHPEKGYQVLCVVDPEKKINSAAMPPHVAVYHGLNTIRPAVTTHRIALVVIAPHLRKDDSALRELYELLFWQVQIQDLPAFYESVTGRIPPSTFSEGWFLDHLKNKEMPVYTKFRTLMDYLAAAVIGLVCVALFPFVALGIRLGSPGPIFIRQKRVGQDGKPFTLYKFRSMYALSPDGSAEPHGVQFAKKDDKRVTPFGKFLRKTRLDELPQVINLFTRDITLIGPRPERPEIVAELTRQMPYYPLRHTVRPGLTSWALLHQNYTDTLETSLQKLQYDLYYIKNRSFLLDMSILARTIGVLGKMIGQ